MRISTKGRYGVRFLMDLVLHHQAGNVTYIDDRITAILQAVTLKDMAERQRDMLQKQTTEYSM